MAQQLIIQLPHDQDESVVFRGTPFGGASAKGTLSIFLMATLFGCFLVLFKSILPFSQLWPSLGWFNAHVIWVALSIASTALTVLLLTAFARILRNL